MDLCMLASNHTKPTPVTDRNTRHRLSSQPGIRHQRGMYRRLGHLQRKLLPTLISRHCTNLTQACLPLPLHLTLAQDPSSLPSGQQRLGIPKVRPINNRLCHLDRPPTLASPHSTMHSSIDFPRSRHLPHITLYPEAQKEQLCGWREEHNPSDVDKFGLISHDQRDSITTWRIRVALTLMKGRNMPFYDPITPVQLGE